MLKFTVMTKRGQLIGLGFSEGNFEKLKLALPIKIEYVALGLSRPGGIICAYPTPTVEGVKDWLPDIWSLIEMNDETMTYLRSGRLLESSLSKDFHIIMFWGKDENELRARVGGLIGPDTEDRSPAISDGPHRAKL
jgi:hypothetical protein